MNKRTFLKVVALSPAALFSMQSKALADFGKRAKALDVNTHRHITFLVRFPGLPYDCLRAHEVRRVDANTVLACYYASRRVDILGYINLLGVPEYFRRELVMTNGDRFELKLTTTPTYAD